MTDTDISIAAVLRKTLDDTRAAAAQRIAELEQRVAADTQEIAELRLLLGEGTTAPKKKKARKQGAKRGAAEAYIAKAGGRFPSALEIVASTGCTLQTARRALKTRNLAS